MRLSGKRALVTGGASGFGLGIAEKFVAEGAFVYIADINHDAAQQVALQFGESAQALGVDVSNGDSVQAMAVEVLNQGELDILVNNAGITHTKGDLENVDEDAFNRVFNVNCKSVYLTAKAFVPSMKKAGRGAILNVASTAGVSPRAQLNWYNCSKGWMITATKTMAVELAPSGIRVNAINPVAGETPLLASFMGEDTPEMREKFISTIPLGRFSTPQDMGNAASFLCSDEASMVTGIAMEVDGGRCI
ncbi:MAG: glucose 1-dehydrogenase [Pseudomonadota bacterium]